jgi:hypothetical protein
MTPSVAVPVGSDFVAELLIVPADFSKLDLDQQSQAIFGVGRRLLRITSRNTCCEQINSTLPSKPALLLPRDPFGPSV